MVSSRSTRRRLVVERLQPVERARAFAGGTRARRVALDDEVEGRRSHRHQGVPQAQRLGVVAARRGALAGEHQRPRIGRRSCARACQRRVGVVALARGVGLERELAPVVRDARCERAAAAALQLLGDLDRGAPVARALVQVEQGEVRLGVERRSGERLVGAFGAVEQARLEIVLGQAVLGLVALALGQVGAAEQVLVDAHRALVFATPAKQVAEREVELRGVGVLLHGLDEGIDRLVVLLVEEQVQALVVDLLRALQLAPSLARVPARGDPAERERQRQRPEQPLEVKVHRAADGSAATTHRPRSAGAVMGLSSARRVRVRAMRRCRHQLGTIAKMPNAQPMPKAARTMKTIGACHS